MGKIRGVRMIDHYLTMPGKLYDGSMREPDESTSMPVLVYSTETRQTGILYRSVIERLPENYWEDKYWMPVEDLLPEQLHHE